MKRSTLMWILWPSFLMAGVTSAAVFALVDPLDIVVFGSIEVSRQQAYACGFFLFWFMAALSSTLTWFISPRPDEEDQLVEPI